MITSVCGRAVPAGKGISSSPWPIASGRSNCGPNARKPGRCRPPAIADWVILTPPKKHSRGSDRLPPLSAPRVFDPTQLDVPGQTRRRGMDRTHSRIGALKLRKFLRISSFFVRFDQACQSSGDTFHGGGIEPHVTPQHGKRPDDHRYPINQHHRIGCHCRAGGLSAADRNFKLLKQGDPLCPNSTSSPALSD